MCVCHTNHGVGVSKNESNCLLEDKMEGIGNSEGEGGSKSQEIPEGRGAV